MSGLFDDLYNPPLAQDAADLFAEANRVSAIPDTSREAYHAIRHDLPRREALVMLYLVRYRSVRKHDPTAYELFQFMVREGGARDLNDVRPKLTRLHERGEVEITGARPCAISGHRAMTWAPIEKEKGRS